MTSYQYAAARVGWLLALPLLLVNSAAIWGQAGWAHEHITEPGWIPWASWVVAVLFAVAVESIGVFLAGMAHAARMADQSAGMLQLGSYVIGLLVGLLNYWHFAGSAFTPTAQAVAFGALSALSPWLWAIYSRYRNRDRLTQLGQVDMRGLKLSTSRKFWHPIKSVSVIRFASWEGIIQPDAAVKAWEASRSTSREIATAKAAFLDAQPGLATVLPFGPVEPAESDEDEPEELAGPRVDPWAFSRELRLVKPEQLIYPPIEPADPVDPPVFQEPARPASDEQLIEVFGDKLRELRDSGRLNRYQVEQLTGAARRQADRLIDQIANETDHSDHMVTGQRT